MNTNTMLLGLLACLWASMGPSVASAEDAEPDKNTAAKPPELRALDRLIGTWNSETISRPAEWTPKEVRATGVLTREWVLDGRFVQEKGHSDKGDAIVMFGFDAQRRVYRMWHFHSDGVADDGTGRWDEATQTFLWRTESPNGFTVTASIHFVDNDTHEWKAAVKDNAGKVYYDGGGKCIRRK